MSGKNKAEVYRENAVPHVERLLSSMDRKKSSGTYGCFCRPYWQDKTMDFPSAHQQIGVLPLAIVYTEELEGNPYYGDERIGELCRAGLLYWSKIQRDDGSFDEHYPREYSYGATAWTLWAVSESVLRLEDSVDEEVKDAVASSAGFISEQGEPGTLANHRAVAANALLKASKIVEDIDREAVEQELQTVFELQSDEGWFKEYTGPDIGYQSTTISHLADIWCQEAGLVEREVIENALGFFDSFIDSENYYGGRLGSRHTQHVHTSGFERLAGEFEKAEAIASAARTNLEERRMLTPEAMDDKHFSRLQADYLLSYLDADELGSRAEQVRSAEYTGILVERDGERKLFVNKSRGGFLKCYNQGERVLLDPGITVTEDGDYYTSNWPGSTEKVERDSDKIYITGRLKRLSDSNLSGAKFLLNRLYQHTVGRSRRASLWTKKSLIQHLITGSVDGDRFTRKIDMEGEVCVEDEAPGNQVEGASRSSFVPASEFFSNLRD